MHTSANILVSSLPQSVRVRLLKDFEPVVLSPGQILHQQPGLVTHVYFLEGAVVSMLLYTNEGQSVDVGMVGGEGMVGIPFTPGSRSPWRSVVRAGGLAQRIASSQFHEQVRRSPSLQSAVLGYLVSIEAQSAQMTVCNRFHSLLQRTALTLLLLQDRIGPKRELPLSHETLAEMTGAYRPATTVALQSLRRAGLIGQMKRGRIRILDRRGLEAASCDCYTALAEARGGADRMLMTG